MWSSQQLAFVETTRRSLKVTETFRKGSEFCQEPNPKPETLNHSLNTLAFKLEVCDLDRAAGQQQRSPEARFRV